MRATKQQREWDSPGCAAMTEVMTPDALLREIACGKKKRRHGRWHENRSGVIWRGRWKKPVYAQPRDWHEAL